MAWYYCSNHEKPLIFTNPTEAPACSRCRRPTLPCNNAVRYDRPGDYRLVWQDAEDKVVFRMEIGNYHIILTDDVLPYDTPAFDSHLALEPPGGGSWFSAVAGHAAGRRLRDGGIISPRLNTTRVLLGQNDQGRAFGLAHIVKGHGAMLHTITGKPPKAPATFDLVKLRDNLRSMTAAYGPGVGVRWVGKQTNNGRYVIHGIANFQHAMLIVDLEWKLVTAYQGDKMSGLGQSPVKIREWP